MLLYLDNKDSIALRSAKSVATPSPSPSTSTLQGSYKSLLVHCILFSIFIGHPQHPAINPGISFNITLFEYPMYTYMYDGYNRTKESLI